MTKARDLRELIAQQAASPMEQKALEATADRLETLLAQDVPYRPEFKAELRRKLMAQARRQAPPTPWIRRPAVWGSAVAMAAAVGILAVGLQLWKPQSPAQPAQPPVAAAPAGNGSDVRNFPVAGANLPDIYLPDDPLPTGAPGPDANYGADWRQGLVVYQVPGRPDEALFRSMAAGLGLHGQVVAEAGPDGGWSEVDGTRTLRLTADGHVMYNDTAPAAGAAGADPAAVAKSFLDRAALPMPSQPVIMVDSGKTMYRVMYMQAVSQRPVVNAAQTVTVTDTGAVVAVDAYLQAVPKPESQRKVMAPDVALQQANDKGGGKFDGVDLVYVRGVRDQTGYLLPFWRVFGTADQGVRFVRYIPALFAAE